jgi:predicted Zn-dependent protease
MAPADGKAVLILKLAQGSSAQAAASEFAQQNNVQIASNNAQQINGLPAYVILGDIVPQAQEGQQTQQSQPIRLLAAFIQYGGNIYQLMGLSLQADFARYQRDFEFSISNFKEVTDRSKLDREPERIKIYSVPTAGTLQSALQTAGTPTDRLEELAILNGMNLTDRVNAGMLIKTIGNPNRAKK